MGSNPIISTIWSVSEVVNTRDFHSRSTGSNPVPTTNDSIAQPVEQQTVNLWVVGSSPTVVAIWLYSVTG